MKNIKNRLRRFYQSQAFCPGFPGMFINPFYFSRKELTKHVKKVAPYIKGRALDVGCGLKPYRHLFATSKYIGLELDSEERRKKSKADYFYDGHRFPFNNGEFDSVMTFQVLEHVFNPDEFLDEVNRVLKPGGIMVLTVPFIWDEHEQPNDYARYSSFGIEFLLNKQGFKIIEQRKTADDIRVIFQLLNSYLYKISLPQKYWIKFFLYVFFIFPTNILGSILYKILPSNNDMYLDNLIVARKP